MRVPLVAAVVLLLAVPAVSPEEPAPVKALPGNNACPYPADAHKLRVAGPVRFMAQVRPDGTVESVEVEKVPLPRLAFEETVRACVADWRFEAAPKREDGLRRYRGRVRFRIAPQEEEAIRVALERLAEAVSTSDLRAIGGLEAPLPEPPNARTRFIVDKTHLSEFQARVLDAFDARPKAHDWLLQLEPDVEHLRFIDDQVIWVRQAYERSRVLGAETTDAQVETGMIDAALHKGAQGWRFVSVIRPGSNDQIAPVRVGGPIAEPPYLKKVAPVYPDVAKLARVQGDVVLECTLSPEGQVIDLKVMRGIPLLDQAALDAVRQSLFAPTIVNGVAVPIVMTLKVPFRLR